MYGIESKAIKPGQVVLTQGTGGVSVVAVQLAKAAGAIVIATTSSEEKAKFLKKLGADHVINYKEQTNWGEIAKSLSPNKEGVDHVLEVGGSGTMAQSLKAVKLEGVISVIGFLSGPGSEKQPSAQEALQSGCIIRGIPVGSKAQFNALNRAIDASNIRPVVDKTFTFEQAKEAYQYVWDQKHTGKVVIHPGK